VAEQPALSFAGLLRQLRAEARLTQEELAEAASLSPRSVSDLERGISRTAHKDTAVLLAGALSLAGPARELFVAAARGRGPAAEVLAARHAGAAGAVAAAVSGGLPREVAGVTGGAGGWAGPLTFLFTDIEGSTGLLRRLGEGAYAQVLAGHHELIRSALAARGGTEVVMQGDGFFAVFSSPRSCVAAVLEMQQALQAREWPGGEQIRVRMGIHCGEAVETAAGLVGLEVHRAARIAAVGYGGQVLVSEPAAGLVRDWLPEGVALADLGIHRLKDLGRPERLFQLRAAGLQPEFPPLRSLGNPALLNNLPAQLSAFIGRGRELAEVRALVESSRLVTLTGAGGSGKTRLGLQAAAGLLDGSGDGVWLAELAAVTDQDGVPAAVAGALRIPPQPGRDVLDTLADALAPQDILIVLDNCEHLIGGCAKTAEVILRRCPRAHVLATSREPLGIAGETIYRVPPLSLPGEDDADSASAAGSSDAVALLAARAAAQGVSLDLDGNTLGLAVSVCRRLDGMPLAIELAASRLRSMSLPDLHARLDQRFGLLTGGSRTALERQQTLRAAVGWSFSLLAAAEQVLLARLSVFAGGFDLPAAEAVCGFGAVDAAEVAGLLGSLVDKSLVVAEPAGGTLRYRLLETIRLFAAERLASAGHEAAEAPEAHCAYYLAVAEGAAPHLFGPGQGSWFDRLEADHANLRRAGEHAAREPDGTSRVLRFGIALWRYWGARFRSEEAAGLLVPVLGRPEAAADPALFAEALRAAATLTAVTDVSASVQLAQQADQAARGLGDNRLLVLTCWALCGAYLQAGEWERACRAGQESVERARALGDDVLLGISLHAHGSSVHFCESGPLHAEAIACAERSGDLFTSLAVHNDAGFNGLQAGDIPAARAHIEAALRAADAVGLLHTVALGNLAEVLRAEGDLDGARSGFQDVVRMSRRVGDKWALSGAILGLACLAAELVDWHRAAMLHGAADALLNQIGARNVLFDERRRQENLDQATAALGDEQLQQAYAHGMALSLDQAIDLALGKSSPP
jgi:predicted ATPase/class 3 adenylate cyclase/DNA-binding XRE family transcriptional regulator